MAQFKISEYPAKTVFNDGDLYDISTYDGVSAYTSEKLTFAQLKAELNSALSFLSSGDNVSILTNDAGYVTGNLYTADGTLTGNRTVTLNGFDLLFSSTGDANTFSIDDSSGYVGFGVLTPAEKIDILGNILLSGVLKITDDILYKSTAGTEAEAIKQTQETGKIIYDGLTGGLLHIDDDWTTILSASDASGNDLLNIDENWLIELGNPYNRPFELRYDNNTAISYLKIKYPDYANDGAADADSNLLSGEQYTVSGTDRFIRIKP